jgi:hypothetical protein
MLEGVDSLGRRVHDRRAVTIERGEHEKVLADRPVLPYDDPAHVGLHDPRSHMT